MTGLGLGATVSVKWVGLFTIAWVGSLTVLQLWILLGDVKTVTPVRIKRYWLKVNANWCSEFLQNIWLLASSV